MLSLTILGPVRVAVDGVERPLRSARQQAIVFALALEAGGTVGIGRLVAAAWGDSPPASARSNLRTHVAAVRRALGDGDRLVSGPSGYALRVGRDELDWLRFQDDVALAGAAERDGDPAGAAALLGRALRCWSGTLPEHLRAGLFEPEIAAMEEARTAAVERLAALGRPAEVVPVLRAALERHPYRESLHAATVLALHRAGDRRAAREQHEAACRAVRDELGVEPGPALLDLVPVLAAAPEPVPRRRGRKVPAQLPAVLGGFVDRPDERGRLAAGLAGPVRVAVVHGRPGTGKSVLAVQVATAARDRYPDGQLYADLHGAGDSGAEVCRTLRAFVRSLRPKGRLPAGEDELLGLYRTLLADRAALVLLDGAVSERQVWPLLPSGSGSAALVTSRAGLWRVPCEVRLRVGPLRPVEATSLLAGLIGGGRTRAEPSACRQIVESCGGLALAVRSAGSRLAAAPHRTLAEYATRLDGGDLLAALDDGSGGIGDVLESAYRSWSPPVREALSGLARWAGPVFDERTAAEVLARSPGGTADLLDELVAADLVDVLDAALYRVPAPLGALCRRLTA